MNASHAAEKTKRAKAMPKPAKILLWIFGSIFGLIVIALVAVNVIVHVMYSQYFDDATREFQIPEMDSGFIPQDLDYNPELDAWLFSGYMADGSPSPIFIKNVFGDVNAIYVNSPDGEPYAGHGSAITTTESLAFLACEGGYYVIDLYDIANAESGQTVNAQMKVELGISPAFMNLQHGKLYAGVFYRPENYETPDEMHITTPNGQENHAVMFSYPESEDTVYGFAEYPDTVYSIPGLVQGMSITDGGSIVFSTSYGLATSHLLVYEAPYEQEGLTFAVGDEQIPLAFFDDSNLTYSLDAPPMTEGIESYGGRIYISDESASNKYIFGKLYGAGWVNSIAF